MTPEERQSIIDEAVEKALMLLPDVMNNLLQEKIAMQKLAKDWYATNKEFDKHKDIVGTTIEEIETINPGIGYQKILDKATPEIKKRIALIGKVNLTNTHKPDNTNNQDHGDI